MRGESLLIRGNASGTDEYGAREGDFVNCRVDIESTEYFFDFAGADLAERVGGEGWWIDEGVAVDGC